jgi:hypothetical protein
MPVSEIFLAPCANEASRNYLKKSVLGSVPRKVYKQYTDNNLGNSVAIWGVKEGELEASWKKINQNDYLLFYTGSSPIRSPISQTYEYAAQVKSTEKTVNFPRFYGRDILGLPVLVPPPVDRGHISYTCLSRFPSTYRTRKFRNMQTTLPISIHRNSCHMEEVKK